MIFVFGNGLSIGVDPRLATPAITKRVVAALGSTDIRVLQELAQLGTPEDPDTAPVAVDRGTFEQLAGPVDRLTDALVAVQRLFAGSATIPLLASLQEAADGLRQHYVRIVGTVLREVDDCCVMKDADAERHASWRRMDDFAAELVELRATIFTLNYDSLLMSAMLNQTDYVYDGFRSGFLNDPLASWGNPTLYSLHGAVGWHRAVDGSVYKRGLDDVRREHLLEAWVAGDVDRGFPAVILTDLKTRLTRQYPFSTFYEELRHELTRESLVVVGGYSFGDLPLNRALARFLSEQSENRLLVWNPGGTKGEYLDRLQKQLLDKERPVSREQVSVEPVRLPDADALRIL